jgi:hypothetical protein
MTISELHFETLKKIERKRISTAHAEMLILLNETFWDKLNYWFSLKFIFSRATDLSLSRDESDYVDKLIDDMIENEV